MPNIMMISFVIHYISLWMDINGSPSMIGDEMPLTYIKFIVNNKTLWLCVILIPGDCNILRYYNYKML